jgi:hypothetical protein
LSAGNTPACIVNKIRADIFGTGNVDTGEGVITTTLASVAHLGEGLTIPCPYCEGDVTPGDGVRDGTCQLGDDDGAPCDVDGTNWSFPAPGGDGHSIDCLPNSGKNVSGSGLKIKFTQSTGASAIGSAVTCGFPPFVTYKCHCGICSNDESVPCSTNEECPSGGTCKAAGNGAPLPNQCAGNGVCKDLGNNTGLCDQGPNDRFCDALLKVDGSGFISCLGNADCEPGTIGSDAGACTLVAGRPCFLDNITSQGQASPNAPLGAATFCIPPTSNGGINTVAGLPGPGRVLTQTETRTFCSSDQDVRYTPGVGGCP